MAKQYEFIRILNGIWKKNGWSSLIKDRCNPYTCTRTSYICTSSHKSQEERSARERLSTAVSNYQARVDLAASYRGMHFYGMGEGVCNHLTLRAPAADGNGDVMLLVPHGTHWSEVTASCLLGICLDSGDVVEGDGIAEASATNIHMAIHNTMAPKIQSVMHTHTPYATALACLEDSRVRMVHQNSMRFFGKIAYDSDYDGLPDVEDEGPRLARMLGDKEILMMGNHGVLAVGHSAAYAFDSLYYLEKACLFQVLAMSAGTKLHEKPDNIAKKVAESFDAITVYADRHLDGLKKHLARQEPHFMS
ncbi:putative aldolase class 2 protein CC_1201 [Amphiura filiformis]|uniref:putative aldolase class 2 protein CC_1201 n=1 Tax=Amphiura filiformis TaxID=82378 RepID=UPI003B20D406